jgi:hypothetical protein
MEWLRCGPESVSIRATAVYGRTSLTVPGGCWTAWQPTKTVDPIFHDMRRSKVVTLVFGESLSLDFGKVTHDYSVGG